jgi:hypothetical protein
MVSEQLNLFEEFSHKNLIKNVDYVDLSTLPNDPMREKYGDSGFQYKDLPKDTYIIYKTGGLNKYKLEKGKIFPFVQNKNNGKILQISSTKTDLYPKVGINTKEFSMLTRMHRLVGLAFFNIPDTFYVVGKNWVVNHIDHDITNYEVSNCEWVTQKENCKDKKDSIKEQQKIKFIFS